MKIGSQEVCGPKVDIPTTLVFHFTLVSLIAGECIIWTGTFLASAHVLNNIPLYPRWFGYAMIISPLFTTYVLTKVPFLSFGSSMQISGIPPLERQMNRRLRGRQDYEEYKKNTPILIPKL